MSIREQATRVRAWRSRSGNGRWLVVGLLVVLAFLGHDLLMAVPVGAVAPNTPAPAATSHTVARHSPVPHPTACQIGQSVVMMVRQADDSLLELERLSATAFIGALAEIWQHSSVSAAIVAPTRSPAVRRAFLQIYRM